MSGGRELQHALHVFGRRILNRERIVIALPENVQAGRVLHHVALQRQLIQPFEILQCLVNAAFWKEIEIERCSAELQVEIDECNPSVRLRCEQVCDVAGEERGAAAALRIDERRDAAVVAGNRGLSFDLDALHRFEQIECHERPGEQITRACLHGRAHDLRVLRRTENDQRGTSIRRARSEGGELIAPRRAQMKDQHVRRRGHAMQGIEVSVGGKTVLHVGVRQ